MSISKDLYYTVLCRVIDRQTHLLAKRGQNLAYGPLTEFYSYFL